MNNTKSQIILASSSPRRKNLLNSTGFSIVCETPQINETPLPEELPQDYVRRIAREKADFVIDRLGSITHPVLAADTIVVLDGRILGKPLDDEDAFNMLKSLSGRTHDVYTGTVVRSAKYSESLAVKTGVRFRRLSDNEIKWYIKTGEPADKAGAYAIQGMGASMVASLNGSYSNVVGLPLSETVDMLDRAGAVMPWNINSTI